VVQVNGEWYFAESVPGKGVASLGLTEEGLGSGATGDRVRDQMF
jgi:hypothetical protein